MCVWASSRSIAEGKLNFINWLDIQIPEDLDWLLLGYFNLIRKPEDRSNSGGNLTEIFLFNVNESIYKLGLVEIPLQGRKFTSCRWAVSGRRAQLSAKARPYRHLNMSGHAEGHGGPLGPCQPVAALHLPTRNPATPRAKHVAPQLLAPSAAHRYSTSSLLREPSHRHAGVERVSTQVAMRARLWSWEMGTREAGGTVGDERRRCG
jgi:hypothetical protein